LTATGALIGAARWLADCDLHYWGDLDTHGFAMLDRRSMFPSADRVVSQFEILEGK